MLASAMYLTQAGKITLLNSLPTSLTILFLCTFKMHATVIKQRKYTYGRALTLTAESHQKLLVRLSNGLHVKKKKEDWGAMNLTTQYEAVLRKKIAQVLQ